MRLTFIRLEWQRFMGAGILEPREEMASGFAQKIPLDFCLLLLRRRATPEFSPAFQGREEITGFAAVALATIES
jgi:hypothetical protein